MKRVDVLEGHPQERFAHFGGDVLSDVPDPILQALVEESAQRLQMPMGLVSLMLGRTQFFRAHTGLPADLATAGATDRAVSFCQFVVKDEKALVVNDAASRPELPTQLTESYGVRAYLGTPIRVGGAVVGSFCVIDVKERTFSEEDLSVLSSLADRVGARLRELNRERDAVRLGLVGTVAGPTVGELRNALTPLFIGLDELRILLSDMRPLLRALGAGVDMSRLAAVLADATHAHDEAHALLASVEHAAHRTRRSIDALERILRASPAPAPLANVTAAAEEFARHVIKLCGGVTWDMAGLSDVVVEHGESCAALLAAGLCELARPGPHPEPIRGTLSSEADSVTIRLTAPAPEDRAASCARLVAALVPAHLRAHAHAEEKALVVVLPRAGSAHDNAPRQEFGFPSR